MNSVQQAQFEQQARADYERYCGKVLLVTFLFAYPKGEEGAGRKEITLKQPARFRVVEQHPYPAADINNWHDGFLCPYWNIVLIDRDHPELQGYDGFHTFGIGYDSLKGLDIAARLDAIKEARKYWVPQDGDPDNQRSVEDELWTLRTGVARIAQALGVDNQLEVGGKAFNELFDLAKQQGRGWNDLCGVVVERVHSMQRQLKEMIPE